MKALIAPAVLVALIFASALNVVLQRYETRSLFIELTALRKQKDELDREWGQLLLEQGTWGAQEFLEWELLEFSIVPVPANADALRLAIKTLTVSKYGRVLSRANEQRIRDASGLLEQVLAGLGDVEQPEEEQRASAPDEPTANDEPNTDDINSDGAELLADLLDKFLDTIFPKEE